MTNHFNNNWVYNDLLLSKQGHDTIITYNPKSNLSKVYPIAEIKQSIADYSANGAPIYAYFTVHFSQDSTELDYTANRYSLYEVLQKFGSYRSFTTFIVTFLIANIQKHQMKKSLIKKLYSASPESQIIDRSDAQTAFDTEQPVNAENRDEQLKKAITERQIFVYGYWQGYFYEFFNNWYFCCCKRRAKREDFLQKDALSKLHSEIDILEIVKKLRVHSFASERTLTPE